MKPRYAIYFTPPVDSLWWRLGSQWLGYDAAKGCRLTPPKAPGFTRAQLDHLTARAARYGFHATLKAPFSLAPGYTEDDLCAQLKKFTAAQPALRHLNFQIEFLKDFLALRPSNGVAELQQLAHACVLTFDYLRAPLGDAELARRYRLGLSARQTNLLQLWGYPYVMEEFRFHMTLSDSLDHPTGERLKAYLQDYFQPVLAAPCAIDALCLFQQPNSDAYFRLSARFDLQGLQKPGKSY